MPRIVIDTNVLVSALSSDRGSAYRLIMLIGQGRFDTCLSVPLVLEYEEVCKRHGDRLRLTETELNDVLDELCRVSLQARVHFKWPLLSDRDDEMVLEVAVAANCEFLVTFNTRNFHGAPQFGIRVVTPYEFLQLIGESA